MQRRKGEQQIKAETQLDDVVLCQKVHEERIGQRKLLNIQECPDYFKDNLYILSGYRPPGLQPLQYLKSVVQVHNDTFNIWSHLFGAILFAVLLPYTVKLVTEQSADMSNTAYDISAFAIFLVGGTLMYSCSVAYHIFWPLSQTMLITCSKIDYMGIVFMIWGTYYPFVRFLFYDDARIYLKYSLALVTLALVYACALLPSYIQKPEYRWVRQFLFWALGSVIPIVMVHGIMKYGVGSWEMKTFGYPLIHGCLIYLFGSVLFAMQAPEKYIPGKCDRCGGSHNIMHVCVVIASVLHYAWFIKSFKERNSWYS